MDQKQPQPTPAGRVKAKFTPKPPPQRKPKLELNDTDNNEDEAEEAQRLMKKFNENLRRRVPRVERKSTVEVAFGPGATVSTSLRTYGTPSGESAGGSRSGLRDSTNYDGKNVILPLTTATEDEAIKYPSDDIDALPMKIKKDYREPWDYNNTYYPTTLPLRRPYSGDPELLNEADFGEAARKLKYDEKTINPASDLGLLEECDKERMFFFQLPPKLPLVRRSASAKGKEKVEGSITSQGKDTSKKESNLEGLSGGFMGKMLVYRSGAVKLKLGDALYDVSTGSDCVFTQDVMAINTAAKQCCTIGELQTQRVVVTPDVDSLLDSVINLS